MFAFAPTPQAELRARCCRRFLPPTTVQCPHLPRKLHPTTSAPWAPRMQELNDERKACRLSRTVQSGDPRVVIWAVPCATPSHPLPMLLDAKQIIYPAQVIPEPVSTAPCLPMSLLRRRCRPALRRRRCRPGGRGRRQYHEPARSVRIALGVRWRESRRYQTPQCPSGSAQPAATKWTCALHWHSEDPLPVFMVASRSVRILSTHKATNPP